MAKKIKILFLIFALGFFIIPKQMLFAQNYEITCCNSSSEKKDCCKHEKKDEKPCHDNEKSDGCGDACFTCSTCHFVATFVPLKSEEPFTSTRKIKVEKEKFIYITPEISAIFSKIWQPPKIG